MIDAPSFGGPATDHRQIVFLNLYVALEIGAGGAGCVRVQGKNQHAARAFVQSVQRPHRPADLVAQQLDGEARFPRVQPGAVHQQPRRLVDGDQVRVLVQNRQHVVRIVPGQGAGL